MKSVRLAFFILYLVALVVVAGCGSQDRYQVVGPGTGLVVVENDWAILTDVQGFFNSYDPSLAIEWQGDLVIGAYDQLIYRIVPGGYEPLPTLPQNFNMRGLAVGPDGNLWASSSYGTVLRLENGQWEAEASLDPICTYRGMLVDNLGRVLVYGSQGILWRRQDSGDWVQQELPDTQDILRSWCEHGAPPVFVTGNCQLLEEVAGQWQLSDLPCEYTNYDYPQYSVGEDGRRVLLVSSYGGFWLDEGEGWVFQNLDFFVRHLFWIGNELYAVGGYDNVIFRWQDGTFVEVVNVATSTSGAWSFPRAGKRQLLLEDGASVLFDGTTLSEFNPQIGRCLGLWEFEGQKHLLVSRGMFLKKEDGIWRNLGFPLPDNDYVSNTYPWLVDDQGQITFFGSLEVVRWDGQDYHSHSLADPLRKIYPQPDGSVVLITLNQVGLWSEGSVRWLGRLDMNANNIRSCALEADGRIWILSNSTLTLVEAETSTLVTTFQGWQPIRILTDPDRGLVVCGEDRLIVLNGSTVTDHSPLWRSNAELVPGSVLNLALDGMGGWVAYDDRLQAMLHYDGQTWEGLDHNFWWEFGSSGSIVHLGAGSFMLNYGSDIFRLEINP